MGGTVAKRGRRREWFSRGTEVGGRKDAGTGSEREGQHKEERENKLTQRRKKRQHLQEKSSGKIATCRWEWVMKEVQPVKLQKVGAVGDGQRSQKKK